MEDASILPVPNFCAIDRYQSFWSASFSKGPGLKNSLKKVTMGVNAAFFASNKSDFKKNSRSAVVLFVPINFSSVISHLCVSFSEDVFL